MNKVYSVKNEFFTNKFICFANIVQRHKFANYGTISECIQDVSFVTLKGA